MGSQSRRGTLARLVAVLGLVSLSFLLGAAVVFFDLPGAALLEKAFLGGRALMQRTTASAAAGDLESYSEAVIVKDTPDKTCDGFTLVTIGQQAFLMDMAGRVVHRWGAPFREV